MKKVLRFEKDSVEFIELPTTLDEWYEKLNCDMFEVVYLNIGGTTYCIYCDEFVPEDAEYSFIFNTKPVAGIKGTFIIVKADTFNGETLPLDEADIKIILGSSGDPDTAGVVLAVNPLGETVWMTKEVLTSYVDTISLLHSKTVGGVV